MAVRMLNYLGLLYQDLIHSREIAADGRLPPILPIVLYNGRRRWNAAQDIADLIAHPPGQLENYRPRLRYLLIDESAYHDADLAALHNRVAALFRLENSHDPQPVREVLTALADWLKRLNNWNYAIPSYSGSSRFFSEPGYRKLHYPN